MGRTWVGHGLSLLCAGLLLALLTACGPSVTFTGAITPTPTPTPSATPTPTPAPTPTPFRAPTPTPSPSPSPSPSPTPTPSVTSRSFTALPDSKRSVSDAATGTLNQLAAQPNAPFSDD